MAWKDSKFARDNRKKWRKCNGINWTCKKEILKLRGSVTQCSKIRKKVQFQKYKNRFFAISKMAKNQFLH